MSGVCENERDNKGSVFVRSLLAGGLAGTTVDISLYPIDTLKTRVQSAQGFAAAGGFRGVYKGVGSAIVGSAPGAALFFVSYEATKNYIQALSQDRYDGKSPSKLGAAASHMVAASLGEVAACAVRVPTEVVKQRAQASQHPSSLSSLKAILDKRRTGSLAAVFTELYRGWSITVIREVPFTVIQFPLWEAMKDWRLRNTHKTENTAAESAIFGCISGAVAAAITTPLDVLKTRMMLATDTLNIRQHVRLIYTESGSRAFFSGIGPRVAWIAAGGAVFLGSYQWASNALSNLV